MSVEGGRAPFQRYLELMQARGFRPSRRLGQNFLLDPSLHRFMVDAAGVEADDLVLEIGAGLGFLTRELAARGARVLAVEVDHRLHGILADELHDFPDAGRRVRLCLGDALTSSHLSPWLLEALDEELAACTGRFLVASNLPYSVAGPVLGELTALPRPVERGVVLVQAELAARVRASPQDADYGSLSVVLQAGYEVEVLRRVGRSVFRPRPSVDSAVLRFTQLAAPASIGDSAALRVEFGQFVRLLFSGRRKKLRNALGPACAAFDVAIPELPTAWLDCRPDALEGSAFVEIWRRVRSLP